MVQYFSHVHSGRLEGPLSLISRQANTSEMVRDSDTTFDLSLKDVSIGGRVGQEAHLKTSMLFSNLILVHGERKLCG